MDCRWLRPQFQYLRKSMEGDQRIRIVQRVPDQAGFTQQFVGVELQMAGELVESME